MTNRRKRAPKPEQVRAAAARLYQARLHIEALFQIATALRSRAAAMTPEDLLALERRNKNPYQGPLDVTLPDVAYAAIGGDADALPAMRAYNATFDWNLESVLEGHLPEPEPDLPFFRCVECPGLGQLSITEMRAHLTSEHGDEFVEVDSEPSTVQIGNIDRVDGLPQLRMNFEGAECAI